MREAVSLIGAGPKETTISGAGGYGVAVIDASYMDSDTTISGFTIAPADSSTAIHCTNVNSLVITGNIISGFAAAAIRCDDASPIITNNTISDSYLAINCGGGAAPIITNNIIRNNLTGIHTRWSHPTITNNTITGSTVAGVYCYGYRPAITNCIIWGNGEDLFDCFATYSDIEDATNGAGLGNISTPPSFVGTATGDLHLSADSPCIDVGTSTGAPATDKDGIYRPQGGGYDMGAYEYFDTCTLRYAAGPGGTISSGVTAQTVDYDTSGTPVTVSANAGYHFVNWSDGKTANPRTDIGVKANLNVTANFARTVSYKNVYRFRNLKSGYYLWSADESEKATIINTLSKTWKYEGVAYQINTASQANQSPLWRFRKVKGGFYLYSADAGEKASVIANLARFWQYEGEAYRVSTTGGAPVWRFRNKRDGTYLYSADPAERGTINSTLYKTWVEEGVAYYIAP